MKTFQINCIIYDKVNPSLENTEVVEIELHTVIASESLESALDTIPLLYNIKKIIDTQEIL
jgi:hypothetical protein